MSGTRQRIDRVQLEPGQSDELDVLRDEHDDAADVAIVNPASATPKPANRRSARPSQARDHRDGDAPGANNDPGPAGAASRRCVPASPSQYNGSRTSVARPCHVSRYPVPRYVRKLKEPDTAGERERPPRPGATGRQRDPDQPQVEDGDRHEGAAERRPVMTHEVHEAPVGDRSELLLADRQPRQVVGEQAIGDRQEPGEEARGQQPERGSRQQTGAIGEPRQRGPTGIALAGQCAIHR